MKNLLLCAGLAGLLALPGGVAAHEPKPNATAVPVAAADPATTKVLAVVEQFGAALKAGNMESVGAMLADDVLILESGGVERSRKEYLGGHAMHDAVFLKTAHVEVKHRTARLEGPLAWVGTESEMHITKDGKPATILSTETMVLKRSGVDWRIVHIHWSSGAKH